jgi:hypothetical protein
MEPRKKQTQVVPESAVLWFGVTHRQHAALLASITYFAAKLQDPREREVAQQVRQIIASPHYWSLPSDGEAPSALAEQISKIAPSELLALGDRAPSAPSVPSTPSAPVEKKKGFGGFK